MPASDRTLGLHPTIWRKLRAKHPGLDIVVYGRDGFAIGKIFLFRYESLVSIPADMDFRAISWKQTIDKTEPTDLGMLGPTRISIGQRRWG